MLTCCNQEGSAKKEAWELTPKLAIFKKIKCGNSRKELAIIGNSTIMPRCYARDNMPFVHLRDVWSYTQEILLKYTSSIQVTKKVW